MHEREIFRPKSGIFLSGCVLVLALCFILSAALNGGLLAAIAWSVAAVDSAYLIFVRPKVIYSSDKLEIINPIDEISIGWGDIDLVDAKWCMSITSKYGRFNAWAAPAPSRNHSRKIHASELRAMEIAGRESISPARSPKSDSGIAVHMAQVRLKEFSGGDTQFTHTKNWRWAALLGLSISAAPILTLLGY